MSSDDTNAAAKEGWAKKKRRETKAQIAEETKRKPKAGRTIYVFRWVRILTAAETNQTASVRYRY